MRIVLLILLMNLTACISALPRSHDADPLGWYGHWAETGPNGAQNVDLALREWNG